MRGLRVFFALCLMVLPAVPAAAQDAFRIALSGIGPEAITLTPESIAGLPPIEMDVTYQTSRGTSGRRFAGVLFWDVLQAQGAFEGMEHNAELAKTFAVSAADDYVIAFSVGEIHPDFGNTPMILADKLDGKPFEGGFRIIVPGDTRGARNVRDVVGIELR